MQTVLGKFSVASMMTYGGEPLLYPDITTKLHRIALELNVPSQELITNGYFSRDKSKINFVVNELKKAGVTKVFLSVDSFHQEYIPIEYVELFIGSVISNGFEKFLLHPAWLISEDSENEYNNKTHKILNYLKDKYKVNVSMGTIISPAGLSRNNLRQYYENRLLNLEKRCGEIAFTNPLTNINNLRFLPNGDVNICRGLCIGNVFVDTIESILENYDPYHNRIISMLMDGGIKRLVESSRERGTPVDVNQYYGLCDLCADCIKVLKKVKENE
jgi:hypothetical protein